MDTMVRRSSLTDARNGRGQLTFEGKNGQKKNLLLVTKRRFRQFYKPWYVAGVQGFEPQLTDPESAVLPLNDTPMCMHVICGLYITLCGPGCQAFFLQISNYSSADGNSGRYAEGVE